jgi:hypothetical protein
MGGSASTWDMGTFADANSTTNGGDPVGITLSDNQKLSVTEGPNPGKWASVGEVIGSSNNGNLTPVVNQYILEANGVQIPPNSVVPYQGAFLIEFASSGPRITDIGLQFMLQADGITAYVNEDGFTGLHVTYPTASGTGTYSDPNFLTDGTPLSITFGGNHDGNTTTASVDSDNGITEMAGPNASGSDNFVYKYWVSYSSA